VEAVQNQIYDNWELILIDDGSVDNSGLICDEFSQIDKRLHVFHQPNGGASSTRNTGIENASGKYLCFVIQMIWFLPICLKDCSRFKEKRMQMSFIVLL
jgi:glycosyltransferase involved in cell wall biosynthesis